MIGFNGIPAMGDGFGGANKRRAGRFRIEGRQCCLGAIEDISATGMRCRVRGNLGKGDGLYAIELPTAQGPVEAKVRLIWSRRFGLLRRVVGVEFVEPDPEVRAAAMRVASETAADFRMRRIA